MSFTNEIIADFKELGADAPDKRQGKNCHYTMAEYVMGAYSVFYMQSPSWLNFQRQLDKCAGQSNFNTLFNVDSIPSDNQIRYMLDGIDPNYFKPIVDNIHERLLEGGIIDQFHVLGDRTLISIDGTGFYSSKKIKCDNCNTKTHKKTNETEYHHNMLGVTICSPNSTEVLPLTPIFMNSEGFRDNQNTQNLSLKFIKQDCEYNAFKRYIETNIKDVLYLKPIFLLDALYANTKTIELVHQHENSNFIITCKEGKNKTLYEFVDNVQLNKLSKLCKYKPGIDQLYSYEWLNGIPLTDSALPTNVNYMSLSVINIPKTNQNDILSEDPKNSSQNDDKIIKFSYITDIEINDDNIEKLISFGRTRWRIENGYNSLKNRGYNFEHNFGHGKSTLANVLAFFIIIAFLMHTASFFLDSDYKDALSLFSSKRAFFQEMFIISRYIIFADFKNIFKIMQDKDVSYKYLDTS